MPSMTEHMLHVGAQGADVEQHRPALGVGVPCVRRARHLHCTLLRTQFGPDPLAPPLSVDSGLKHPSSHVHNWAEGMRRVRSSSPVRS